MESAYAATLSKRERRLASRLEGFGDIVFGFAVSQCAIQLPTINGRTDVGHIGSLFGYFGTFAILVVLWMTFHSMMSVSFRPARLDLFLAFAYLALVTLMPYALYNTTHGSASLALARSSVGDYAVIFAILLLLAAMVTVRNLRRGWHILDEDERLHAWHAFIRRTSLAAVLLIATAVDVLVGPLQSTFVFLTMPVVPRLVQLAFKMPTVRLLRLPAESPTPA